MNTPELRARTAARLQAAAGQVGTMQAFLGLDGFVDEILHVVDKRESAEKYTRLPTIEEIPVVCEVPVVVEFYAK